MSTLVLAGGGTGGHVFPMVAVADALRVIAPEVELLFVGTRRGIEGRVTAERGYELELLEVQPLRGGGAWGAARGVVHAARAVQHAVQLLRRRRARAVFSVGGYAAGPAALAARLLGVPLALLEPNAVIGLTNRLIAPFVQRAYTTFAESEGHFRARVVRRWGVPIRSGFGPQPYSRETARLRLLVLGGSQGAKALNERVPQALAQVEREVRVVHQCGPAHEAEVRQLYASLGLSDRVQVVPFIHGMAEALAAADLVISRSGAGALSEICAVGRPSVLVPYPYAASDHQRVNAEALARAGAAVSVTSAEATPERLAQIIDDLSKDSHKLARMAAQAAALGRPDAAMNIALDLLELGGFGALTTSARRAAARAGLAEAG